MSLGDGGKFYGNKKILFNEPFIIKHMENKISEDDFYEIYKPQKNHLDSNAAFDGCMFETYGEELGHVLFILKNPDTAKTVWTIIDDNNGTMYYGAGFHYINRLGYLITEKPYQHEADYVELDNDFE